MPMTDGVGQGDPLSCILFNLFIEPLARFVSALGGAPGVMVEGVNVRALLFADDMCNLASSPAELQVVLDATQCWATAWGMEVGISKTNAVHFPPPSRAQVGPPTSGLPPLFVGGQPIQWVPRYRYLGYWTWWDLRNRGTPREGSNAAEPGFLDEIERRASAAWRTVIEAHSLVRAAPAAFILQLFRTSVSGSVNYLLCLTEPTKATRTIIDRLSLRVARLALRLDAKCPSALAWAESRLPPAAGIMARERMRFMLQLQHSPFDSFARRILRALAWGGSWRPRQRSSRARSWVHRALDLSHAYRLHGVPLIGIFGACEAGRYNDIKRAAGVYGRAVSLHEWRAGGLRSCGGDGTPAAADATARPAPCPPSQHCADLHFGYRLPLDPASVGGIQTRTPLSARGPQCAGGLMSLVTRQLDARHLHALGALRKGRAGMFQHPLAAPASSFGAAIDGTIAGPEREARIHQWAHNAFHAAPCRLCGMGPEDPLHVLVECVAPPVVAARSAALSDLPRRILTIVALALAGHHSDEHIPADAVQLFLAVRQLLLDSRFNWASHDGRFVLFRVLAVLTWPASVATQATPLAAALGRVFDHVVAKTHRLRRLANSWVGFAAATVARIFDSFNAACPEPGAPASATSTIALDSDWALWPPMPADHDWALWPLSTGPGCTMRLPPLARHGVGISQAAAAHVPASPTSRHVAGAAG